ncbi:hypothetical protein [Rhodococcus sp. IEGM 1330]|nr:hypothetical protein [Rhodococcus sp. IEGM 1330]MDV8023013.1 hypothetical protein [Rhodococcus sp. IEGM 1330]
MSDLLDLVVAPIFYRYQFADHPATTDYAHMLAVRGWASLMAR